METSNKLLNQNRRPFSEEDTIAQARDVFGVIPPWYQENKGLIEKTRLEIAEKNVKFAQEIQLQLDSLHETLSKVAFVKTTSRDK